ncbi:MAG: LPS export ABC transporter periplasmic protein LptC, partial [Candidatus Zixiibacteriota bacterium]
MKRNRIKFILIFLLLSFFACSNEETKSPAPQVNAPDQVMENSTITFSDKGINSAIIWAKYIEVFEKLDLKKARQVRIDFYDKDGVHTSVLVADSGRIQERKHKFEALGHVVVTTDDGVKLTTQSLRWDPDINRIVTDDFVTITKDKNVISGYGLEADQQLNH